LRCTPIPGFRKAGAPGSLFPSGLCTGLQVPYLTRSDYSWRSEPVAFENGIDTCPEFAENVFEAEQFGDLFGRYMLKELFVLQDKIAQVNFFDQLSMALRCTSR